jgi:2,4-dienoyl-CoA reductase-like NADH-dependent reductase (Old Yellow Enzyme family)
VQSRNRLFKAPLTERLCTWHDTDLNERGKPTTEYLKLYEEWGKGGYGVITLGSMSSGRFACSSQILRSDLPVDARYPEAAGNPFIDMKATWDHVKAFKPVIDACKAHGALCIVRQLCTPCYSVDQDAGPNHARWSPVQRHLRRLRPLAERCSMSFIRRHDVRQAVRTMTLFHFESLTWACRVPMTVEQIQDVVKRLAYAAKVLYDAGADGCQLHSAHVSLVLLSHSPLTLSKGYLFSQFLSPRTNLRTDAYGGSLENRSRIHLETIKEIRRVVPDERFMIHCKLNSDDFIKNGMNADDAREMVCCRYFARRNVLIAWCSASSWKAGASRSLS